MTRWWTEEEASRAALARVDDSDVVQGVGTAVLGYHGLAYEQLRPLTVRTLVDIEQVQKALGEVDLEPVAKALAEATRPVMGEAADRYGQVLAEDMHARSITNTSQLISNLASSGLPWPMAIQRAADLHGVPFDRLGSALQTFRAPVLNPMAQMDMADRVLMEYASHRGKRENTVRDISKAKARSQDFEEEEHPRAGDGTFTHKARQQASAGEVDAAKERIALLKLRQGRQNRNKARRLKVQSTDRAGASLHEIDDEEPAGGGGRRQQAMSPRQEAISEAQSALDVVRSKMVDRQAKRLALAAAQRKQAALTQLQSALNPKPPKPAPTGAVDPWDIAQPLANEPRDENGKFSGVVMPTFHKRYVLVPEHVAVDIVKQKGVNIGALIHRTDDPQMVAMRHPEMTMALTQLGINAARAPRDQGPASQVMLVFDGDIAFADGSDNSADFGELATGGTYYRYTPIGLMDSIQTPEGFDILPGMFSYKPHPAAPKNVDFSRAIHLKLSNDKDIAGRSNELEPDRTEEEEDVPSLPQDRFGTWDPPSTRTSTSKAADGDFEEEEHPRGPKGRFRDKAVTPELAQPKSLLERQAARKQRKSRQKHRQVRNVSRHSARMHEIEDEPTKTSARQQAITERQQQITTTREGLANQQAIRLMQSRAMKQNAHNIEERRRLAAEGKGPNLGLAGGQAANLPPDVLATLVDMGRDGGTYEDSRDQIIAEQDALDALTSFSDTVDELVQETRSTYAPIPVRSEGVVVVYEDSIEANEAGRLAIKVIAYNSGKYPIMRALDYDDRRLYPAVIPVDGGWTVEIRAFIPDSDLFVVSDDDQQRWAARGAPVRVVAGDPVTLSELMAESGQYSPEEIEQIPDRYVAIHRLDFGDDV